MRDRRQLAFGVLMVALLFTGCEARSSRPSAVDASPDGGGPGADAPVADVVTRAANPTCHAPPDPIAAGLDGLPRLLSETGCFQPDDPTRPATALIPYDVNAPLWSDGAEKDRWFALPDGARIQVAADGDFVFPPGAVLIKTFRLGARRVETRFFVRHPGGQWSGYTYEWNEAGTDAALLDEGSHRRRIGDRDWHFPSRTECDSCHTAGAGFALGLELAQLNRADVDQRGGAAPVNQLDRLAQLGLFEAPLSDAPGRLPALPSPSDERVALEPRARAYLHANCSNCHRPEIGNSGTTDLRFATPLSMTRSCDALPLKGTLGYGVGVKVIAPATPEQSMVVLRMRALDSARMPTVASLAIDDAGVALMAAWITSLSACP